MKKLRINVGPFAAAEKRIGDFGINLLSMTMVQESIEKLQLAEEAYIEAVENNKEAEDIDKLKLQYDAMKTSFFIATQFAFNDDELSQ